MLVVLDTNVLVAATRSRRGASFRVLRSVGTGAFDVAVSVPPVLEYEGALLRHTDTSGLSGEDAVAIVDYICRVAKQQAIFFLWRPLLKDPKDDMVAEVAVAAGCDAIVTHNRRDFESAESLGLRILSPADFLHEIEEAK